MTHHLFGERGGDGSGAAIDEVGNLRHVGNLVKAAPGQKAKFKTASPDASDAV
jgi:hypothetical protein